MIYFHIPYCKQKCSYCNFHFSTKLNSKEDLITAMHQELHLRKNELLEKKIESIYFGGGTPSILSVSEIQKFIEHCEQYFIFSNQIEITLEANPDDLDANFLNDLQFSRINRLSIGIQSFREEDLLLMNRSHNAQQAESSIKRAQDFGFINLNIDLIYGSPTSNLIHWKENLNKFLSLDIPHLSSYALTIENNTALEKLIMEDKIKAPDEKLQEDAFFYMAEFLTQNGYQHYEISNFSKPNLHSKHNTSYWQQKPYLGIGPSAHSYDGNLVRRWNINNNALYIKSILQGEVKHEKEILTEKQKYNEMMMIGLRTEKGVDIEKISTQFSEMIQLDANKQIQKKLKDKQLYIENRFMKIPKKWWFHADGIASNLFLLD